MKRSNHPEENSSIKKGKPSAIGVFASKEVPLQSLLLSVARGEQQEAEEILKKSDPTTRRKLLSSEDDFTDYSNRTFRCTAFEYAYWAKDTEMCSMLEKYMDDAAKSFIFPLIKEMERIDERTGKAVGLAYKQDNKKYSSAHFDFTPLIEALDRYVSCVLTGYRNENESNWMEVGKAQRDVPAHVAQYYCRSRELTFKNETTGKEASWFPLDDNSGLGFTFALLLSPSGAVAVGGESRCKRLKYADYDFAEFGHIMGSRDLEAMRKLDKAKTLELKPLRDNLDPSISRCSLM